MQNVLLLLNAYKKPLTRLFWSFIRSSLADDICR